MDYQKLVDVYSCLEKTAKRLEKTKIISDLFKDCEEKDVIQVIYLLQGRVFSSSDKRKLGMNSKLIIKTIHTATGSSVNEIEKLFKKLGDLGSVCEILIKNKKQTTFFSKKLSLDKVFSNLQKLAVLEGHGAVNKKVQLVSELLSGANPVESKFIIRTIISDLRVGVATGILRDAIAQAYDKDPKTVEVAFNICGDYSEVAVKSKSNRLDDVRFVPGKALKLMLAIGVKDIEEGFDEVGDEIKLFTRSLENVTKQFPDVVSYVKKYVKAKEFILDSEIVGFDPKTKMHLPFQKISQRIKRKYEVDKLIRELPVEINVFDILYLEGKNLMNIKQILRLKYLDKIIENHKNKIKIVERKITKDKVLAKKFFERALELGYEGAMIKNPNALYKPGRYVKGWYKLKSVLEPLDLVIIGAVWGEGKRAKWLSSFNVACKDGNKFLEIGKVGTGIKEKKEGVNFTELTKLLKPLIIKEKGQTVFVKPEVIVEVIYEEIQKSPKYNSGFALRFPRLSNLRTDKPLNEINSLKEVIRIYRNQKK